LQPPSDSSDPMRPEGPRSGSSASLVLAVWIFPVVMRLADLVALALGGAKLSGSIGSGLGEAIVNWDGHWYLGIASGGYSYVPGTDSNVAFFPVFPMAMRYLGSALGIGYAWAGVCISVAAAVVISPVMYRLVASRLGEEVARRAVVALAVFPTGFFFVLPYPDAAFALAVSAAFYCAATDRFFAAAVFAFVSSGLKIFGILLALSFLWIALDRAGWSTAGFRRRAFLSSMAAAVAALAGTGAYSVFLWVRFKNPVAYYSAQMDGWPHDRTAVFQPVIGTVGELMRPGSYIGGLRPDLYWAHLLDVVAILVSVIVLAAVAKRIDRSWLIFWIGTASVALLSGTTNSFARYLLAVFAFFAGAGILLTKRALRVPVLFLCACSQLALAYAFGRGWWVG
jgi:hypothetical protein